MTRDGSVGSIFGGRRLVGIALACLAVAAIVAVRTGLPRRAHAARHESGPNVLIIIGDDHAADTLGVMGDPHGATPRLDALAKQGALFRRAYCSSPICTASRAALMTGRLPHALGVNKLATPLPLSAITLGDWLGDAGYTTAAYGKMHFNSWYKHGFDDRIDTPDYERHLKAVPPPGGDRRKKWKPLHDPADVWLNAEARPLGLPDSATEATYYVDRFREFLARPHPHPFAMVVGFYEPHAPFKFPDDWTRRFRPDDFAVPEVRPADLADQPLIFRGMTPEQTRGIQAAYHTSIAYVDAKVGQILDHLDASGRANDTIVVYLGDNGYLRGQHGRFEKHCFYEQAVRMPILIRWPGHVPAGRTIDDLVEGVDLLPTLLDLIGVEPPPGLQGESFAPLALGRPGAHGREAVFSEYLVNEEVMAADDRYKLIVGSGRRKRDDGYLTARPTPGPYERLYDLQSDPDETVNLADRPDHAEIKARLVRSLVRRMRATGAIPDTPADPAASDLDQVRRGLKPAD